MNFTTAVIHRVDDLFTAASFLTDVMGFNQQSITADGTLVENGALAIRLVQIDDAQHSVGLLHLEMQTNDINQAASELLDRPDIQLIQQLIEISQQRTETHLQGPHGIIIILAQEFNEDDLGIIPPLPTSLDWQQDAEDCVKQILLQVPIGFRQGARTRITERAEMLVAEYGLISVDVDRAVLALAQVTPIFQHKGIETALKERGIDPGDLFKQEVPQ